MQLPAIIQQLRAHTHLSSSVDTLAYRNGQIVAQLNLSPEQQSDFERRVENLKLQLHSCLKAAQDDYQRELRKLFVEFGQIAAEPPAELANVITKLERDAAE